jgi:hypothetical protein
MLRRFAVNPLVGVRALLGRVAWLRLVILAEMLVLLGFAVALTVAPQISLGVVAQVAILARDFSMSSRPAVALVGLVLVGVTATGLQALLRGSKGGSKGARRGPTALRGASTPVGAPTMEFGLTDHLPARK